MMTLACPECAQVMHRVPTATEQSVQAGYDQLSRHCFAEHVLPALERMLTWTAEHYAGRPEELIYRTQLFCPGCDTLDMLDSLHYVRLCGRTVLCCSVACVEKVRLAQ